MIVSAGCLADRGAVFVFVEKIAASDRSLGGRFKFGSLLVAVPCLLIIVFVRLLCLVPGGVRFDYATNSPATGELVFAKIGVVINCFGVRFDYGALAGERWLRGCCSFCRLGLAMCLVLPWGLLVVVF